ncbi:MAG: 30S ribosomal protein S21 [Victivallaceae bacterium]
MPITTEVRVKKGEAIDRALRRLKKKLDKEGTLKELRNRRHFEKPSEVKRRKSQRKG